jgi:trypsin
LLTQDQINFPYCNTPFGFSDYILDLNMKFCLIYTVFALAACFHAASAKRTLKSTVTTSDSGNFGTLSSEDSPLPSPASSPTSNRKRRTLKGASGRISYGQQATDTQFPYVIYFDSDGGICSGSVIAPRVILTAAHCVYDEEIDGFIDRTNSHIYFGSVDYDSTYDAGEIKAFYMPSQYSGSVSSNLGDVGLVELVQPLPSYIKPVTMANAATKIPAGTELTVAGWGEMENGEMADHLMYTTGRTLSAADCEALHVAEFDYELDADHFCVAVPQDTMQTTCGGDSGGPYLMINVNNGKTIQVGATSFGPSGDCGTKMAVDVPVSIRYWRRWIDNTMSMYNMKGVTAPVKLNVPAYNQCYKGGTVLLSKVTSTYGKCLELCQSVTMPECRAWTWQEGGSCTLLTATGIVTKSNKCTSGYFK